MINAFFTAASLVVLVVAVFLKDKTQPKVNSNQNVLSEASEEALNEETSQAPSPTLKAASIEEKAVNGAIPSLTPAPVLSPSPSPKPPANSSAEWIYPGSEKMGEKDGQSSYRSGDDTKKITDWYKEMFKKQNYKITSFIQTSKSGQGENSVNVSTKNSASSGGNTVIQNNIKASSSSGGDQSNYEIFNKLVGASGSGAVEVEITKEANENFTTIKIKFTS